MDEIAEYNRSRWNELVEAGIEWSRPLLSLTAEASRALVDEAGFLGDLTGKQVLCLGGGGGQQSAAFGILGAKVTVLDLSEAQLERDREAAAHYGYSVELVQGDMRDLSAWADDVFDAVYQPYSINFVPDPRRVFQEVARVLRPQGIYRVAFHNPFTISIDEEAWTGDGYLIKDAYVDGEDVTAQYPDWTVESEAGAVTTVAGPHEFRHTLSTMMNGLIGNGFVLLALWEETSNEPDPEPGTWEHFKLVAPPYLRVWTVLRPDAYTDVERTEAR